MGKKSEKQHKKRRNHVKADVIILGCTLPGIVTAHSLKKKFGDSMDIVVLDLPGGGSFRGSNSVPSRYNVAFQEETSKTSNPTTEDEPEPTQTQPAVEVPPYANNMARYYLTKYSQEFGIPLPSSIMNPEAVESSLNKLFQYRNGSIVECTQNYHDFDYLNFVERFELEQYQALLNTCMQYLFQVGTDYTEAERMRLMYYDKTNMEEHICNALLFPTSREIMRTIVRLACGTATENVSVLFYLHQCFRSHSSKNHIDGDNTRFREKLLGYCRKRLSHNLLQSVADITLSSKPIKEIRTYADEQVILEPEIGETDYICNLLAMALRPDQLREIHLENGLLSTSDVGVTTEMIGGTGKKFVVQYEENFWRRDGYSGDILSVRGPIIWAMERPDIGSVGKTQTSSLVGYLKVANGETDCKEAVLEQLVKLFGEEAANPVRYKETKIRDIFVPRRGDFVALQSLTSESSPKFLEWGALDIFADGDVAAAIEAGHTAYLHLLGCLRPQALTYEDMAPGIWPINLAGSFAGVTASVNIVSTSRLLVYGVLLVIGVRLARFYLQK